MNNRSNAIVIGDVDYRGLISYYVTYDYFDEELNKTLKLKSALLPESQAKELAESINNPVEVEFANDLY